MFFYLYGTRLRGMGASLLPMAPRVFAEVSNTRETCRSGAKERGTSTVRSGGRRNTGSLVLWGEELGYIVFRPCPFGTILPHTHCEGDRNGPQRSGSPGTDVGPNHYTRYRQDNSLSVIANIDID
jgi:hypothetical protein